MTPTSSLLPAAALRSISLVIPAHNEEGNVAVVLDACMEVFDRLGGTAEVVLVDNASTDRTADIARRYAEQDPRVRVLENRRNMGAAPSMLVGFLAATGDAAMFLPADRQIMPDQLLPCLKALAGADVVCTHRANRADPAHRRLIAGSYNWLVRRLFRLPLHDVDSSFLARRAIIEDVAPALSENSGFIPVEFLVRASRRGARIVEIPIEHHPRVEGEQEGVDFIHTVKTLASLVRFAVRLRLKGGIR